MLSEAEYISQHGTKVPVKIFGGALIPALKSGAITKICSFATALYHLSTSCFLAILLPRVKTRRYGLIKNSLWHFSAECAQLRATQPFPYYTYAYTPSAITPLFF
jgi:hypothetical protein